MKVTVLMENTTSSAALTCEHGLSLLIEDADRTLLLDAGSSEAFLGNAEAMGIDLKRVDMAVLSHGHYDHSGGFGAFMALNDRAPLYWMDSAGLDYQSGSREGTHYIGVPDSFRAILASRLREVSTVTEIAPGVHLVPHSTPGLERIGAAKKLYRREETTLFPDDFRHEKTLVYDTPEGLVLFNSCSHGGITAIVEEVRRALPGRPLLAFFGGLHMKGRKQGQEICTFSPSEVAEMADYIRASGMKYLYTGHCTGAVAFGMLREHLGELVREMPTGYVIEL